MTHGSSDDVPVHCDGSGTRFQGTDSVHEIKSILFSKVNVGILKLGCN